MIRMFLLVVQVLMPFERWEAGTWDGGGEGRGIQVCIFPSNPHPPSGHLPCPIIALPLDTSFRGGGFADLT